MRTAQVLKAVVLGLASGGCASIISGTSQLMTVNANVDGAEVLFITDEGQQVLGTTPLSTRVKRGQEGTLRVSAEGYRPYESALNRKINSVFWVNILSGGLFGSTTDYTTGAMYSYEPSTYMVTLQPVDQSPDERKEWERREALRGFVLLNNEALVSDLAVGNGDYIDVLLTVFEVTPDGQAAAIEQWRSDYAQSQTVVDFAQTIVAKLDR